MLAAGMLFAACSSDKDVAETGQGVPDVDGAHYVAIGINLPMTPASVVRGANDVFDDGLPAEYVVNNATLFIFKSATSEDDAVFHEAYNISPEPWSSSSDTQVTEISKKIVQKVGSGVAAGDLALVILNNNGAFTLDGTNFKFKGESTNFSGKFSDFKDQLMQSTTGGQTEMWANGFYMANAPLTKLQGSSTTAIAYTDASDFQTLVPITTVYESETAAAAGAASQIYVERGMAKVTLNKTITTATSTVKTLTGDKTLTFEILGWVLDNTNKKSYNVRSTAGFNTFVPLHSHKTGGIYRFAGNTAITQGAPTTYKYRTYFSQDPNYTGSYTLADEFNTLALTTDLDWTNTSERKYATTFGTPNPQYCFENTFDVDGQIEQKTTVARLAVQAKVTGEGSAENLYIINGNKASIYRTTDVQTYAANAAIKYINDHSMLASGTLSSSDFDVTVTPSGTTASVDVTIKSANESQLTSEGQKAFTSAGTDHTTTMTTLNGSSYMGSVVCYQDGISYYTIRIKHFGDDLTPWKESEAEADYLPSAEHGVYPTQYQADNYLGRYGVLRNNWYDITVSNLSNLGAVTPESLKTVTDDEIDSYITFQINVLSWAKRTQSWSF